MGTKSRYSFYVEEKAFTTTDRPRKFLEAFAAVLKHSNYALPLEAWPAAEQVRARGDGGAGARGRKLGAPRPGRVADARGVREGAVHFYQELYYCGHLYQELY